MAAMNAPPVIFAPTRRFAVRRRMIVRQNRLSAAHYLLDDMVEDIAERLAFLRHDPPRSLVIGDWSGALAARLSGVIEQAGPGFDSEAPFPGGEYDFIASLGALDTANDLPGALIHMRAALAPGGLAIASFVGAGSLPGLRAAMLAADGERPAPRLHPMVDVRGGGRLLQRAGWADPVVDSRTVEVRFASLDRLVADLRDQGLSNALARPGPPLTRSGWDRARTVLGQGTVETFEILTLSGWKR